MSINQILERKMTEQKSQILKPCNFHYMVIVWFLLKYKDLPAINTLVFEGVF